MPPILTTSFVAGEAGGWAITDIEEVKGEALPAAERLAIGPRGDVSTLAGNVAWALHGVVGHVRYVHAAEKSALASVQPPLGRERATRAALIPIRKSAAWWDLAQDERRAILEERSRHIALGMQYLPAIARRLYQSRELGEPFDFLTWFEYAPEHATAFEDLTAQLRGSEEWTYVEREVDIRLAR